MTDYPLAYFRDKIKIKEKTISDAYPALIERWTKIVEDCGKSGDTSNYRKDYASEYMRQLLLLKTAYKGCDLTVWINEAFVDADERRITVRSVGCRDALNYIVAELEVIYELST